jgi:hypothetical protein
MVSYSKTKFSNRRFAGAAFSLHSCRAGPLNIGRPAGCCCCVTVKVQWFGTQAAGRHQNSVAALHSNSMDGWTISRPAVPRQSGTVGSGPSMNTSRHAPVVGANQCGHRSAVMAVISSALCAQHICALQGQCGGEAMLRAEGRAAK